MLSVLVQRTHSHQWKHGEKKEEDSPPVNVPVSPQSQQSFNLLRHLMFHLNVLRPSNVNHEYLHTGVGQHSLLEYISRASGEHFLHPWKTDRISSCRETWLHVSCDVSIITIHEIQTLTAAPLIWIISRWGGIYRWAEGGRAVKGLGRKTERAWLARLAGESLARLAGKSLAS